MNSDSNEQRRSYRIHAPYRVEASDPSHGPLASEKLRDISQTGARISTGIPVPRGEVVEVRFPDIDGEFVAHGRVIWCNQESERGYEIGVRFDAESSQVEKLCTRIQEIEKFRKTVEDLRGQSLAPEAAAREWTERFGSQV